MAGLCFLDRETATDWDLGIKNRFKWEWMSEKDANGDYFSAYIRKLATDGQAWCCYCNNILTYAKGGKSVLKNHAKGNRHLQFRSERLSNHTLPASMQTTQDKVDGERPAMHLPYGAAPNIERLSKGPMKNPEMPSNPKPVHIRDRVSHLEALVCSFVAEHSLPQSMAPHLVQLSQCMSKDVKALNELSLERQTATYKLRYGLSYLEHLRLVKQLKTTPFSINLDESTSKGSKKRILNVLVCYCCDHLKKSVCHLYTSIEMTVVNAQTVFDAVMGQLRKDEVPLTNIVSVLSDSAAYMRGSTNGFQAKLKEVAPHLIDIDGDVCHHIHNSVKKFMAELDTDSLLSRLLDHNYSDFDFSADLREDLLKICGHLDLPQKVPVQRAGHRWMSIYDSSARLLEILNALTLFYSAWLSVEERKENQELLTQILKTVNKDGRLRIYSILQRLKLKKLTPAGRDRKRIIVKRLFIERNRFLLLANTVVSILPLFKSFILTFEQKEPLVHRLHDELISVLRTFLGCYLTHEYINTYQGKLHKIDVKNQEKYQPLSRIFVSQAAQNILQSLPQEEARTFIWSVLRAYKETADYMKAKLPINSTLLATFSTVDPDLCGHHKAVAGLDSLFDIFYTQTDKQGKDSFSIAASQLQTDQTFTSGISETRLDKWWITVNSNPKYALLAPVVKCFLSVFTGPRVESSFSVMNNIITSVSNRVDVKTYEAEPGAKAGFLNRVIIVEHDCHL